MIQLQLPPRPVQLTDELIGVLTEKYKSTGAHVWNAKFIRDALLAFSFNKCCYSECMLNEEGKYMEVDHFFAKKYFPDRVVEWGNLLPSSKKCNASKGDHDVTKEPILSPFEDPKEHLYFSGYRFRYKTQKGKQTIEVIDLNNWLHFGRKRAAIGQKAIEIMTNIYEEINDDSYLLQDSARKLNKLVRKFKNLLEQATRTNEYAATLATVIITDEYYPRIEQFFYTNGVWDDELTALKSELLFCALLK